MLGLVPVANMSGTKAMAESELMRYLAEAVWYPTALLPSQGMTASVYTPARYHSDKNGVPQITAWRGEFFEPILQGGMRIPARGQVGRISPTGPGTYWRGRIDHVEYQFAPPAGVESP